jgi:hypothetical protein
VTTQVLVRVDEHGACADRLAELADALRTELLALDLDDVKPAPGGDPPPGSRAFDVAAAGALLASLSGSAELISHVVVAARAWLGRGGEVDRTVELTVGDRTLRVTGVSDQQQNRLIDAFLRAVAES